MTEVKTIHHDGHLIELEAPYDNRVMKRYIDLVLKGQMPEDDFWVAMRKEFPILPLDPIRRRIADGAITQAPPKTPPADLVENGWYWILKTPDGEWEIARVEDVAGFPKFYEILKDWSTSYGEILAIGPQIPPYEPEQSDHDHDGGDCPLCPSEDRLAEMREHNRSARAAKLAMVQTEIAEDPSSFVFIIEGYDDLEDRMPVIMRVATSAAKAREYISGVRLTGREIYEVTPHRLDCDRTGEVALFHVSLKDGTATETPCGRHDA